MIRTSVFVLSLTMTLPAFAADTKQMDELHKGFKDAYAEIAKLPADGNGVSKAKVDLLERYRSYFGSALTRALIEDLRGAFDGAFDGLRGPKRVKDALASEKTAIDKEIGRLNGVKGDLGGTKGSLEGKITGLGGEKSKWDGEVNRLINEIKKLGGQASLIGDLPKYAAYPGRPFATPVKQRRSYLRPWHVRLAGHYCWRGSCGKGHGGSTTISEAKKRANKAKSENFNVPDEIDKAGLHNLRMMSRGEFPSGPNALATPDRLKESGLGKFQVDLPPPPVIPDVPTPDPNAGRIDDLKVKLKVARQNATDVAGRIGELAAEIGVLDVNIGSLNDSIRSLTARKGEIDTAAAAIKMKKKYNQLNGKELFQLNSVTWTGATAAAVFEAGKTKVTANVTIFGTATSVSTDWAFAKAAASLSILVSAIKKTAPYKTDIGG